MSARFFANPPGSRPLLDTVRDSIALYFSPIRWLWTRIVRGEEERADDSDLDVSGFLTAVPRVNLQLGSPAFKGWVGHLRDEPLSSRTTEDLEQVFNETTIQLIFRSVLRWTGGISPSWLRISLKKFSSGPGWLHPISLHLKWSPGYLKSRGT